MCLALQLFLLCPGIPVTTTYMCSVPVFRGPLVLHHVHETIASCLTVALDLGCTYGPATPYQGMFDTITVPTGDMTFTITESVELALDGTTSR